MLPDAASDTPRAPRIGRTVNQKTGSPIPAKGPIIPILTPWMAASSIAAPFALFFFKRKRYPDDRSGNVWVSVKRIPCDAQEQPLGLLLRIKFLIAGISEYAQPKFCIRS